MVAALIPRIRQFNRLVTERVGALDETYLKRGRPLGEARLLFEIASAGEAELRALREKLYLDSGYLSRLLRRLEQEGLVVVEVQAGDQRQRLARLSDKGRAEFLAYEELSDGVAASMVGSLDAAQSEALAAAMDEVRRLLRAGMVEFSVVPPESDEAQFCLAAYFRELDERFDTGFDPAANPVSVEEMRPPAGYFVLARLEGAPVGCGALVCHREKGVGEIKRVWTERQARGLGVARRVVQRLEALARESGLSIIRLDTNKALSEAQAFYRKEGYRDIACFNDNPYAHHWFEKHL